ncbi:unnamed protein product [Jaminaea pallidilutea]
MVNPPAPSNASPNAALSGQPSSVDADVEEPPDSGLPTPSISQQTNKQPGDEEASYVATTNNGSRNRAPTLESTAPSTLPRSTSLLSDNSVSNPGDESGLQDDKAQRRHHENASQSVPLWLPSNDADFATVAECAMLRGHCLTGEHVLHLLKSSNKGLTAAEAEERTGLFGPNIVTEQKPTSALTIFIRQVANCLTIVLLAAMALSFGVQDWVEGGVVLAVILTNIIIGFTQEWKAERTMASLRDLSSPTASVMRDGELRTLPSSDLVPGDIVSFRTGDVLPADVRLLTLTNLETSEAALTGESLPVTKVVDALCDEGLQLGAADRVNLAYSSTVITKGRGTGVVIATGPRTQIGQIAEGLAAKQRTDRGFWSRVWDKTATLLGLRDGTPLQIRLNKFAYVLLGLAVLCAIVVFAVAEFELDSDILLYAIALGIGVIPESLIPVLTITFSVGAKRMAEAGVVVRRIEALEALGGVTHICSDKTGTLTQGRMVVRKMWLPGGGKGRSKGTLFGVEEGASAFEPVGRAYQEGVDERKPLDNDNLPIALSDLATAASLCNIAELSGPTEKEPRWSARGDPTEIALLVMATKLGLGRPKLTNQDVPDTEKSTSAGHVLRAEYPFDSDVKLMTTVYSTPDGSQEIAYTKGAVERVLDRCSKMSLGVSNETTAVDDDVKTAITDQAEKLASQGLRVLAFATRNLTDPVASHTRNTVESDLTLIGLCALYDPPRPTSLPAVQACKRAGITVCMLTGDHASTARAIAKEVAILDDSTEAKNTVMTANQFEALTDEEVDALPSLPLVIARCSPSTKVRMVQAGRRRGFYMAMTGDGVNDAPALKQAPIGIAMGQSGTDVAKAAADMVLTDDCFESIVKAVREGRTIFDNIQRFIIALLVANVGEVILLLIGLAFQDGSGESVFALTAVEILWANMVTASLPAVGLGMEVPSSQIMERPPADVLKAGVFSRAVIWDMLFYGFQMGWTCLVVFVVMVYAVGDGQLGLDCNGSNGSNLCDVVFQARASVFTTLILQNLITAWEMYSLDATMFRLSVFKHIYKNRILFWSVLFGVATIPICLYIPQFNTHVFHHAPLNGIGWGVAIAATVVFTILLELWKWLARRNGWPWLTRISGGTLPPSKDAKDANAVDAARRA